MQSPKYALRQLELSNLFYVAGLKETWRKKVRQAMREFPLRDPLDHMDFHIDLNAQTHQLHDLVVSGQYHPTPPLRVKVEKSKGLCRQLVIPTVEDALVLQRLSDVIHPAIQKKAPTKKAFYDRADHQFKKKSKRSEYGSLKAWLNFQKELFRFSKIRKFIVVTDIANYYDGISYVHLRNCIAPIVEEKESYLDMLVYTLSGMQWQPDYMPRVMIGLPQVNLDAPRALAHCLLYEVDEYLDKLVGFDHARYMDDIDIGVDTLAQARRVLRDVDTILQTRQLRLNSGKTKILTSDDALKHFMIKENYAIEVFEQNVAFKRNAGLSLDKERRWLPKIISKQLKQGRFDQGNGEKVLKRLVNLTTDLGGRVSGVALSKMIVQRPGMRETALRHYTHRQGSIGFLKFISDLIENDTLVDDAAVLTIGRTLFETAFAHTTQIKTAALGIADKVAKVSEFGFYASLYVICKFGTPDEILQHLVGHRKLWFSSPVGGRFAAMATPYLWGTPAHRTFYAQLQRSRNIRALDATQFLEAISINGPSKEILAYCKAPNTSMALGTTPEKFGMILAIRKCSAASFTQKGAVLNAHKKLKADGFLRALLK